MTLYLYLKNLFLIPRFRVNKIYSNFKRQGGIIMTDKDRKVQQDDKDTEKGSQLQSNKMEKAQGNEEKNENDDKKENDD